VGALALGVGSDSGAGGGFRGSGSGMRFCTWPGSTSGRAVCCAWAEDISQSISATAHDNRSANMWVCRNPIVEKAREPRHSRDLNKIRRLKNRINLEDQQRFALIFRSTTAAAPSALQSQGAFYAWPRLPAISAEHHRRRARRDAPADLRRGGGSDALGRRRE